MRSTLYYNLYVFYFRTAVNHIAGLLLQWSYEALKPIKERDHMQLWESGSLILNTSSQSMNAPQAVSNDSETLNPIILPNSQSAIEHRRSIDSTTNFYILLKLQH